LVFRILILRTNLNPNANGKNKKTYARVKAAKKTPPALEPRDKNKGILAALNARSVAVGCCRIGVLVCRSCPLL
jgi:hypothetical protein